MDTAATQPYRYQGRKRLVIFVLFLLALVSTVLWLIWGFTLAEWVSGGLAVVYICYLMVSTLQKKYDGNIVISRKDGKHTFTLELDLHPLDIEQRHSLTFKVVNEPSEDYLDVEMVLKGESQN